MSIQDYSSDADLNVSISGINIAEGCPPSGINNAIRQLMADVKAESEAVSEAVSETSSALEAFAETQAQKDAAQDTAIAGKLDKSGGTMTGHIVLDTNLLACRSIDNECVVIRGGSDGTSASVQISGKNHSLPGWVALIAKDSTNTNSFTVQPNGKGTLNGHEILTSAGGTVTGALALSQDNAIVKPDTKGFLTITGGTKYQNGGFITLFGVDNTSLSGAFRLGAVAADGTFALLYGSVNEGLFWRGRPILTLVASWRSGTNWYRKYSDGWIEQGGLTASMSDGNASVTFHTAFSTTDYSIVSDTYNSSSNSGFSGVRNRRTTGCDIYYEVEDGSGTTQIQWVACGY